MKDVKVTAEWSQDDETLARWQGWYLGFYSNNLRRQNKLWRISAVPQVSARAGWGRDAFNGNDTAALRHVLEQAMIGSKLAYKALRCVVKTNSSYAQYKPMVRAIYKQYYAKGKHGE